MKFVPCLWAFLLALMITVPSIRATVSQSDAEVGRQFERAAAVFEGRVVSSESFIDDSGGIQTRFAIRVYRSYKGRLPGVVSVTLLGGVVGNRGEAVGCQPNLRLGEDRLFFLSRGHRGSLVPTADCASTFEAGRPDFFTTLNQVEALSITSPIVGEDVTDQASFGLAGQVTGGGGVQAVYSGATNVLTSGGIGERFIAPDRGEPIPYVVDMDALPSGITTNQALTAVSHAVAAWAAVSSVRFSFQGIESFGQSAMSSFPGPDGILRIQLHDLYGVIPSGTTLGIGGSDFFTNVHGPGWTMGGQVFGNDFNVSTAGWAILSHTNSSMTVLSTFEEVLCHEIGHALGMAHSTPDTDAPVRSAAWEAQMYYIAHEDGRGASPTAWDTNVLHQINPIDNTPPYMFDRMMDIVTASPQPSVPGINELQLRGYDAQMQTTSVAIAEASGSYGVFALAGDWLTYTANDTYDSGGRLDPQDSTAYDRVYARCQDGTHASPYVQVRVLSFSTDTYPSTSDGVPDSWMQDNFGSVSGALATGDNDHDTIINRDEYRSGMDPNSAASAQLISAAPDGTVSWQGKAYELYELLGSTNVTDWFFVKAVLATNDTPTVQVDPASYQSVVYRAFKVP